MSTGLGIFLSSLVFALILLYLITRDRWSWWRIAQRLSVGTLIVGVIGVVAGGIYVWDRFRPVPKQTEYAGLRLGMTMDETKYIKGFPSQVYKELEGERKGLRRMIALKELEKGKKIEDYNLWGYENTSYRIDLDFDKNKLIVIRCYSGDKLERCPPVGGIRDGDSEQQVVKKLGQPFAASIEGVTKKMWYPDVGAFFYLSQETVYILGIKDTAH